MLRAVRLALAAGAFFSLTFAAFGQSSSSASSQSKSPSDAIARSDAEAEMELQKALASAGNDRAAQVRNLKEYLKRFPDSPRRASVYRALVESCEQLRDNACALDFAERLIAVQPDDSEMMMTAVSLLRQQGEPPSLTRANGYLTRVIDRMEKSKPDERPARTSLADWQSHRDNLRAALYFLRGQVEQSQHKYEPAIQDLSLSFAIRPNAAAAKARGEVAEIRNEHAIAIEQYTYAFVLPEDGPGGRVDRREVRWKLGNLWVQIHGSERGLGEEILGAYDRLTAPPANPGPAARNRKLKDVYAFVLRNLDGKPVPLEPLKGKTAVLSFWATWCGPCRELEPLVVQVAKAYSGNENISFFAVNTDEDQTLVHPFLAQVNWDLPVVYADGLDDFLGVTSLPTVVILDSNGRIAYRVNGYSPEDFTGSLVTAIQSALASAK
jgi:thiol-disulfide isomerase/thioredoxin